MTRGDARKLVNVIIGSNETFIEVKFNTIKYADKIKTFEKMVHEKDESISFHRLTKDSIVFKRH